MRRHCCPLALGLLFIARPALALPDEANLQSRISAVIEPYISAGMFSGVILVAEGDRVLSSQTFGNANYELAVPMRRDMRFRVASISKSLTDAALADLLGRGLIRLDSRVSDFIPDFPRGSEITIQHILDHRSGIPHTNRLPEFETARHMTLHRSIEILKTKPLEFAPGTSRAYSNGGYDVLAAVIERASGLPFREHMQKAVLDPLKLRDTGWADTYKVIPGMVDGYTPGLDPGSRSRAAFYAAEKRPGGGAMYSTVDDLLAFTRAFYWREVPTDPQISSTLFGETTEQYQMVGSQPGAYALIFTDNERKIAVIALANSSTFFDSLGRRLYQAAIGESTPVSPISMEMRRIPENDRAYYEGDFRFRDDPTKIYVDDDGDVIYEAEPDDDWRVALVPLADGRWLHPIFDSICRFEGDNVATSMKCGSPLLNREANFEIPRVEVSSQR